MAHQACGDAVQHIWFTPSLPTMTSIPCWFAGPIWGHMETPATFRVLRAQEAAGEDTKHMLHTLSTQQDLYPYLFAGPM